VLTSTTISCIEAAEAGLGVALPAALRRHYLSANGGTLEVLGLTWDITPVADQADFERTSYDLVQEAKDTRAWKEFPQAAVSIASDGLGNYLILVPTDEDRSILSESLHVWWHEGGEVETLHTSLEEVLARSNISLQADRER
jgi:hypothetical protein